jgi:DNA-binding CsgD family transcriptional regulator
MSQVRMCPRCWGKFTREFNEYFCIDCRLKPRPIRFELTARETQVVAMLREGLTNKQIADELGLKDSTIKVYLGKIFIKMGVKNRLQLALLRSKDDEKSIDRTGAGRAVGATQTSPYGEV